MRLRLTALRTLHTLVPVALLLAVPTPADATPPPPPTITTVSVAGFAMTTGPTTGGTVVTVQGTGLESATVVTFGGIASDTVTVDSATQITAVTPPGSAGAAVDVAVTTPNGTDTRTAAFTYVSDRNPAVLSLTAAGGSLPLGLAISPDSKWLYVATNNNLVMFLDARPTPLADTPTVSETMTLASQVYDVTLSADGSRLYAERPTWNSFNTIDIAGTTRTLSETTTFTNLREVEFSIDGSRFFTASITQNVIRALDSTTKNQLDSITVTFEPTILSVHPAGRYLYVMSGIGNLLNVVDTTDDMTVVDTLTLSANSSQVTFTPDGNRAFISHTESGTVSVLRLDNGRPISIETITGLPGANAVATTPDGRHVYVGSFTQNVVWKIDVSTEQVVDAMAVPWSGYDDLVFSAIEVSPNGNFTYAAWQSPSQLYVFRNPPSIETMSPNNGATAGGSSVRINGFGLSGATAVTFGGVAASSFTVDSATQITAITPAGVAGAVNVVVTGPGGSDTKTSAFTYTAPAPPPPPAPASASGPVATLTSISPSSGPTSGGTQVTITGSFLGNVTGVTFNGVPATSFTIVDSTRVVAVTPAGVAGAVDIMVSSPGSTATYGGAFTYTAPPTPVPPTTQPTVDTPTTTPTPTTPAVRTGSTTAAFAGKSSAVSSTSSKTIERLVTQFGMDARYTITGFKAKGAAALTLARTRARAVQRTLISLGVLYSHITTTFTGTTAAQVKVTAKI